VLTTNLNTIIHQSTVNVDFNTYTYVKVYTGGTGIVITEINGVSTVLVAGTTIDMNVTSIEADSDVYLIGYKTVTPTVIIGGNETPPPSPEPVPLVDSNGNKLVDGDGNVLIIT